MKHSTLFAVCVISGLFGSVQERWKAAGPTRFNHFIFQVPNGWKTMQQADFFLMVPPGLETGELLSYVLLKPLADAGFDKAAETTISEVAASLGGNPAHEISGTGPFYMQENSGRFAKGWDYSKGHALVVAKTGKDAFGLDQLTTYWLGIFLAKINSRIERVVYISKDFRRNFLSCRTYLKPTYQSVVDHFFFDLEFDDWADARSNPGKITHSGISGVWNGLAYFEGSEGQAFSEGSVKATYLAFFDNGQLYYNKVLPKNGFSDINSFAEAALFPRWWGTYTYQHGSGVIKLSYLTIPFSLKDGKLYLELNRTMIPYGLSPASENMRLDGNWCERGEVNGKNACISFTGSGRFHDDGVVLRIEHQIDNCFHSIPESGSGTYEIKDNSILFHYDNGFYYQAAFSGLGMQAGDASPREIRLGFNDDVFTKN